MRTTKYGIASLNRQFPNDTACLEYIFDAGHKRKCRCGGRYKKVASRRQFQCSGCRSQIAPTAGTVFNKSKTSLILWFHAILSFYNAKGEISAKQLERDLEVTYKCAWRILSIIRLVLKVIPSNNSRNLSYTDILAIASRPIQGIRRKNKKYRKLIFKNKKSGAGEIRNYNIF